MRRACASHLQGLRLLLGDELAIDLGTSNTLVYEFGRGVVINEPTVIAFNLDDGRVAAVGRAAEAMVGREPPSIRVVRPLKDGVIADFEAAERLLSILIRRALRRRTVLKPRLLICLPGEITSVERRAVEEAALGAGAGWIDFVEEPLAAAACLIRTGLERASMIVDVGGGTTDIAVLSLGRVIWASTLRKGGGEMDRAVAAHLQQAHGLEVGERTAERVKIKLGSAVPLVDHREMEVGGRNLTTRLPETVKVTGREVQLAIEPVIQEITGAVRATLEELSAEVAADLLESGIVLTGGGAQLPGLRERLGREVGLEVRAAADPMVATVLGAGGLLQPAGSGPSPGSEAEATPASANVGKKGLFGVPVMRRMVKLFNVLGGHR